ncbi:hypothetical protein BU23DRAFT_552458 [Bimuria novae-zelandiae CBS 107.79]|uniref:Uncharacterized protein n=1 Tax=Bimuria novae-zelandiae CBS 107.79 TaxID=1447943 RepID=A0A6A5VEK3_9PLEO|nr:hypothetical protein BU23DRAFT_552458 [Bimuria novae-zelandiae CBS 107.79]
MNHTTSILLAFLGFLCLAMTDFDIYKIQDFTNPNEGQSECDMWTVFEKEPDCKEVMGTQYWFGRADIRPQCPLSIYPLS